MLQKHNALNRYYLLEIPDRIKIFIFVKRLDYLVYDFAVRYTNGICEFYGQTEEGMWRMYIPQIMRGLSYHF